MANFLLVGNGAREHAIAESVCKKKGVKLFAYMSAKNPGISKLCEESGGEFEIGDIEDGEEISGWAKAKKIDLAFASPDAVLSAGVTDSVIAAGIKCASPTKGASRIEWDKRYLRDLMSSNEIEGCPKYGYFENTKGIDKFIDEVGDVAIKPVGLTGGKGVKVVGHQLANLDEAKKYARDVLINAIGGGAVIIEQKLVGEEFTLMAFCDGVNLEFMPTVQDHKLAYDGDSGPNTGGMGSYSDNSRLLPFLKNSEYEKACAIMKKIVLAQGKKDKFVGILYGQFMTCKDGIYVIETNARFGDPEAMNVIAVLENSLYEVFVAMADRKLKDIEIKWEQKATVVKYLVPNGYLQKSVGSSQIEIDYEEINQSGAKIYFASVNEKDGKIFSGKSRSIAVLGKADSIFEAAEIAEEGCHSVDGPLWHRKDIGTKELVQRRIDHMKKLRGN